METGINDLLSKTSFCTCSYLKSSRSRRASIVRSAMQSWDNLLEIPFAEKIFLDDGSPDANGIKTLKLSQKLNKFDQVVYNTLVHPPHCNFGTLASMSLCKSDYIFHIDDDICVTGSERECINLLAKSLEVLDKDETILGINLTTPPSGTAEEWLPGKAYRGSDYFAHPNKYFGSAVSLIRKELLERVGLADIIKWGAQQPANWEILISDDASSFLIPKGSTTFGIDKDSWVVQSTSSGINWPTIRYFLDKKIPAFKKLRATILRKNIP